MNMKVKGDIMSKTMKKIILLIVCCMMLTGTVLTANAQEHEHAFSYVGDYEVGFTVIQTHPYLVNDGNGNMATKQCEVRLYKYQKVYKCGCGMVKKDAVYGVTKHMSCPQK